MCVGACRCVGALAAVRVLAGVLLQEEEPLQGHPGHPWAVQPAGAPRRRQVGPQLGHQVPGRLPLCCGRPRHRSGPGLRLPTQPDMLSIPMLLFQPCAQASARQFLDESWVVLRHMGIGAGANPSLPSPFQCCLPHPYGLIQRLQCRELTKNGKGLVSRHCPAHCRRVCRLMRRNKLPVSFKKTLTHSPGMRPVRARAELCAAGVQARCTARAGSWRRCAGTR